MCLGVCVGRVRSQTAPDLVVHGCVVMVGLVPEFGLVMSGSGNPTYTADSKAPPCRPRIGVRSDGSGISVVRNCDTICITDQHFVLSKQGGAMSTLSLRLPDSLVESTNRLAGLMHMTRSDYIRHALEDYNSKNEQVLYKKQLAESVQEVREQTDTELTEMDASVEDGLSDA